jgi:hypothetical protein
MMPVLHANTIAKGLNAYHHHDCHQRDHQNVLQRQGLH